MNQIDAKQPAVDQYEVIDLYDIIKTLAKRKKTIIGITLICMLISGIWSHFIIDPVYEASTTVAVVSSQNAAQSSGDIEDVVNEMGERPYMSAQSCEQQVKSSAVIKATIDELNLPYSRGRLMSMISTELPKGTNMIKITVANNDPQLAAKIANSLREQFVITVNDINSKKMNQSLQMMQDRWLSDEESELEKASTALKDYKLESRSLEFLLAQLQGKNSQLINYQLRLSQLEINIEKLQKGIEQEQQNLNNTSPTIKTSSTASGILSVDNENLDIKDGSVSSESVNEAYINILNAYNQKSSSLAEAQAEQRKTRQEVSRLEAEIHNLEADLAKSQTEERKLQNEVDRREKVVNLLTSKIAELKMTESLNLAENNIITVSAALVPEGPVKPNKKLNIAAAGILGFVLALFGVLFSQYMRTESIAKK